MKKILAIITFVLISAPIASAMTLWDFYGGRLPSIQERSARYNEFFSDEYRGTAEQNINFLDALTLNQPVQEESNIVLGATLPQGVAVFQTSLLSAITSSASSMTLVANSVRGGSSLSGYQCFTVDEGSSIAEYICGTVSGTSVTSLVRGVDPLTATTTNATLQFAHRRGAEVKVTDFPVIQIMKHQLNGEDTFDNPLVYTSHPSFTLGTQLIDKTYADGLSFAGVATSTEANFGGVWLGTQLQMASSTNGGVNKPYVLQTKYSTSSPYTTGLWIPITRNDGKLSPLFTATTTADTYRWGGLSFFTGDTVLASTTVTSLNIGTITSTSTLATTATSTITNLRIPNNATTTNLVISGNCIGCSNGYSKYVNSGALSTGDLTSTSLTATCGAGKQIISGGFSGVPAPTGSTLYVLNENYANSTTTWTTTVNCTDVAGSGSCSAGTLIVYALCVNP